MRCKEVDYPPYYLHYIIYEIFLTFGLHLKAFIIQRTLRYSFKLLKLDNDFKKHFKKYGHYITT